MNIVVDGIDAFPTGVNLYVWDNTISENITGHFNTLEKTFNAVSGHDYLIGIRVLDTTALSTGLAFRVMAIDASEQDKTFAPYANVCPITGWTECNIYVSPTEDPDDPNKVTYEVKFPNEEGTVYGGTVTIREDGSIKLIVDRATVTINGTETFNDVTSANVFFVTNREIGLLAVSTENDYCNMFKPVAASASSTMLDGEISRHSTANNRLYIKSNIFAGYTASQLAEYFSNHHLEYCGKLASPVSYDLTPQQITSLFGTNNIWTDTGPVSVIYITKEEII